MEITCISDLHGSYPKLDGGQMLIIAGDLVAADKTEQYDEFFYWLGKQRYTHKILIAGNHDGRLEAYMDGKDLEVTYLKDSGTVVTYWKDIRDPMPGQRLEKLKIWGTPWTPEFGQWYFMKPRGEPIAEKWALIPDDVDILVTHGPPHGILDYCSPKRSKRLGCEDLYMRLSGLKQLKLHVFGHIHGGYGHIPMMQDFPGAQFVNASIMDEDYEPINKPIRVTL